MVFVFGFCFMSLKIWVLGVFDLRCLHNCSVECRELYKVGSGVWSCKGYTVGVCLKCSVFKGVKQKPLGAFC